MNSVAHEPGGPVALYCRVSSEDQAQSGTIEAQLHFLRRFCELYGLTVAGEYLDEGVSGTTPFAERPEGSRLLADARDGRFTTVLVYKVDRLARRLKVLLTVYEELEQLGITLRSATEPLDTSTSIGRFFFQLLGSLAELDRDIITERLQLGRERVLRGNKWATGVVPYGYVVDAERQLVPSTVMTPLGTEADVVRSVFRAIANGSSAVKETARLNAAGVPAVTRYVNGRSRENPRGWQHSRMWAMLKEPGYATGVFAYRSRHDTVEITAPPLIDRETWDRVQQQLQRNRTWSRDSAKVPYLLRGLITCGGCGRTFQGRQGPRRTTPYWYYACAGRSATLEIRPEHRCTAPLVRGDILEAIVWQDIRSFILDPGPALAAAQEQLRQRLSRSAELEQERKQLLKRLADLDRGRETILELVRRGRITLADADAQLEALANERAQLQAELDMLRAQSELAAALEAQVSEATTLLQRLRERLDEIEAGGPEAKRPWVERLVSRIVVHWDSNAPPRQRKPIVEITYIFSEPTQRSVCAPQSSTRSYSSLTSCPRPAPILG